MIPPLAALLFWPVVAIIFFKRFSPAVAISLTLVGGHLLLPVQGALDLPVLPALSKTTIPSLTAFIIGAWILKSREREFPPGSIQPGWLPKNKVIAVLFLGTLGASFITVLANGDSLVYGRTVLPGLRPYDAFSLTMRAFVQMLPLLLARKYLARPEDHRTLLLVFCIAGLAYTIPALIEVRLSPQINIWTYGFFPHSWNQHIRGGHYRPVVFLTHGLFLGIFLAASVIATAILMRFEKGRRGKYVFALAWLMVCLFLSRTLGAFMITLVILPVAVFFGVRMQMFFAGAVAVVVLFYPTLRGADLIPVDRAVSAAESYDPARAQSLGFRFRNEDILLEKANQRPLWGWGSWGRNRVYNESGRDISVTDGTWIIIIGSDGWAGYVGKFGLFTIPIILLAFSRRRSQMTLATSGLCLLMSANLTDMLPNSSLTPLTWMIAGALIGRLELERSGQEEDDDPHRVFVQPSGRPGYSRARLRPVPQRVNNDMSAHKPTYVSSRLANRQIRQTQKRQNL